MNIFGKVVEIDGTSPAIITIDDGIITGFRRTSATTLPAAQYSYNINQFLIFPGFVDVNANCKNDTAIEQAIINGGITHLNDTNISSTNAVSYQNRVNEMREHNNITHSACIDHDTVPFGQIPYKAFVGKFNQISFTDYTKLTNVLRQFTDMSVNFECEDADVLNIYKHEKNHEHRHPAIAEYTAVEAIIPIIESCGLRSRIAISTPHAADFIAKARQNGIKVMSEISPHHLFFDYKMLTPENRRFLNTIPPVRSEKERTHLLDLTKKGLIDILSSGHTHATINDKFKGMFGVTQIDTFGAFVAWLIKNAHIDPVTVFKMACKNPGEWVGQFTKTKIGRIAPGYEASITIIDMTKSPVDNRPIYSGWSPFDLRILPGSVQTVFIKGEKVVDDLYIKNDP